MPTEDNLLVGMLKVRNESIRCGNIVRVLHNMSEYCDSIYVVNDASWDSTDKYLYKLLPEENIINVAPEEQSFGAELQWKQTLIEKIHDNGPWKYIFWMDADEVLDSHGTLDIRDFCRANLNSWYQAWSFHYTQMWRNSSWARTDSQFDDGQFIKLWRYHPDLCFDIVPGTHNAQFPRQVWESYKAGRVEKTPWEVLHYGNYSKNLQWKVIQYRNGLGGFERHMNFDNASYRKIDKSLYPSGAEYNREDEPQPEPYSEEFKRKLLKLNNLQNLEKTFCVTISTCNRADTLPRAIDSVLAQTFEDWVLIVVDDGSTDETADLMLKYQEQDPRIFYIRCLEHRGGVAVNEIACDCAVNIAEYWTRLGSDDWFEKNKLELDFKALQNYDAVMGTFQAHDQVTKQFQEKGNFPYPLDKQVECFEREGFLASWADFAVKTKVLKKIKNKHGCYVDSRLMNMEDALFNARVAKISPWVWRGIYKGEFIVNPPTVELMEEITKNQHLVPPTAYWNKDPNGSSANGQVYNKDRMLTTQIILSEKGMMYD